MNIRNLAECIILQSLIDISEPSSRAESVDFLKSQRLVDCAELAGMKGEEIRSLRKFARRYISRARASGKLSATSKLQACKPPIGRNAKTPAKPAAQPYICRFSTSNPGWRRKGENDASH